MSPIPRPNPQLMVIGDSLAQGCRSLTVNAEFCAQSWPARIAQVEQWQFITPDFPRFILVDLEQEIRQLATLGLSIEGLRFEDFFERLRDNLRDWLRNDVESDFPCFDNLGLAGCLIGDLYQRTAASSAADIAKIVPPSSPDPTGGLSDLQLLDILKQLHLDINGRFTLNPSQDPAFDNFTPLDWVRERKPATLIVHVGHNHGVYNIGGDANITPDSDGNIFTQLDFWNQWQGLANRLATLPAEIKTILVALLPKVGAVANLAPEDLDRTDGYADAYDPVFSTSTQTLTGAELANIDTQIRDVNAKMKDILINAQTAAGVPDRLKWVSVYDLLDRYDYKNSLNPQKQIVLSDGTEVDNRYISGKLAFLPPRKVLKTGGFQSIDGMHGTGCGYAVVALEAITALGLLPGPDALLDQGFRDDSLLSDYPLQLNAVVFFLDHLRNALRLADPAIQALLADKEHLLTLLPKLQAIFQPS